MTLIKADEKNKVLWDEVVAEKTRKDLWVEKVQSAFECFACYEVLYKPVTLSCSHNACVSCLKKFDGETLDDQVNDECYQCLRAIMPGYDTIKIEAEKKERKAAPKKQARRSKRQNSD